MATAAAAGIATSAYAACLTVSDVIAADVLSIQDLEAATSSASILLSDGSQSVHSLALDDSA